MVLASDEAFAMPLATTLRSVVEANPKFWPLEFYILEDGFREETKKKVLNSLPEGSARLHWTPVEMSLFAGFSGGYELDLTKITYARLLIPRIVPASVSKLLYLDADLLVLKDLRSLWETDLGGAVIGAVSDFYLHSSHLAEGRDPRLERNSHPLYKGLPDVKDYFNSGVLLIDLDKWRKEGISEKALDYLNRFPHSPHMDQDALNFACDGRWKKLDPQWNAQDHRQRPIGRTGTGIVHFVTRWKPWLADTRNLNAELYDSFRIRTRFARTPLEKLRDRFVRFTTGIRNVVKRGGFRKRRASAALA